MFKIKLKRNEIILLILLLAAALVYSYLKFLIFPQYDRIAALKAEIEHKSKTASQLEKKKKELAALKLRLASDDGQIDSIEKQIPFTRRMPELIVSLDEVIRKYGMKLSFISVGDPDASKDAYSTIPININLEGDYDEFMKFLKYIENNERKFVIESFTFSPPNRKTVTPYAITFKTFMLNDKDKPRPEPLYYPFMRGIQGKDYPFYEQFIPEAVQDIITFENGTGMSVKNTVIPTQVQVEK